MTDWLANITQSSRTWSVVRWLVCGAAVIYLIAPMIVIVIVSLSSAQFLVFPPPSLSLQWYRTVFEDPSWINAIFTSVRIVVPSALIATVLGTAAAVGIARSKIPFIGVVAALLMLPLVVPVMITGAAIYRVAQALGLYGGYTSFILAHCVLTLPYVIATVLPSMKVMDEGLTKAALTLGANPWTAFRRITLPLLFPSILSSFLFALVISFDEVVVTLFLSTPRIRPLSVQIWSDILGGFDPTVAAVGTMIFTLSILALLAERLLRRRIDGKGSPK